MITLAKSDEAYPQHGGCPECGHAEIERDAAHFERSTWVVIVDGKPILESVRPSAHQALAAYGEYREWPP